MLASRSLCAKRCTQVGSQRAWFHASPRAFVKVGDAIPDLEVLREGSPGNKVNLAKELGKKKGLIIGVPAAFSAPILDMLTKLRLTNISRPFML